MPFEKVQKEKCPDCYVCQGCGEIRCRVCRKHGHGAGFSGLASGFTTAEYREWQVRRAKIRNEKDPGH